MKKFALIIIFVNIVFLTSCFKSPGDINSDRNDFNNSEEIQFAAPEIGEEVAVISTSEGKIYIRLFSEYAPMATENFTTLATQAYYNNTQITRVEKDFLIQADTENSTIFNNAAYPVEINDNLHHYTGAVGMVKQSNNEENLNASSFYIIQTAKNSVPGSDAHNLTDQGMREDVADAYKAVGGAPYLDNEYTVFGQVFYGMDIVDKIANVKSNDNGAPIEPVIIQSIDIIPYTEQLTIPISE